MKKTAVVFPGQGSQKIGMIERAIDFLSSDLYDLKFLDSLLKTSQEILGYDPHEVNLDKEKINQTKYTQPLIFITSAIMYNALSQKITPDYVAGHSLGEFSALYAAGNLDFKECLELIKCKAELMHKAGKNKNQGMWAVLGGKTEDIDTMLQNNDNLVIANYNCPGQVVMSGLENEISKLESNLKNIEGIKKITKLAVSGAFHSPFMNGVNNDFRKYLNNYFIKSSSCKIPFVFCNDNICHSPRPEDSIKTDAIFTHFDYQMISPVYWQQMVEYIMKQDADTFIEVPPGRVLSGLIKRINPNVKIINERNLVEFLNTT